MEESAKMLFRGRDPAAKYSIFAVRVAKNEGVRNTPGAPGAPRRATGATGARQSEPGPAAQSHPSTRAGGQDDVSSEQTPSNYIKYSK